MPYSAVSKITIQDGGKITLHITVPGWEAGLPIEISGQATQAHGVVATFYSVQPMPDGDVLVDVEAVPPDHFKAGSPITVVARATEVWITTLRVNKDVGASGGGDPNHPAWIQDKAHWAVAWPGQEVAAEWGSQNAQTPSPTTLRRHGTWWDRRKTNSLGEVIGGASPGCSRT